MAAGTPLIRLTLGAASVTDDLGYVALSDLARALGDIAADCRVIGGHMVTVLAARWRLGHELYRETGDVDLGIPPIVARDHHVVGRLKDLDYTQVAGNRFARGLSDIRRDTAIRGAPIQGAQYQASSAPIWMSPPHPTRSTETKSAPICAAHLISAKSPMDTPDGGSLLGGEDSG
jgi:hypothetical protein